MNRVAFNASKSLPPVPNNLSFEPLMLIQKEQPVSLAKHEEIKQQLVTVTKDVVLDKLINMFSFGDKLLCRKGLVFGMV